MSGHFSSFLSVSRCALVLTLAAALGCSSAATYQRVLPPAANVGDIERIAVAEFDGLEQSGHVVALQLSQGIVDAGYYRLMEREQLDRILEEHELNESGIVDPSTVAELRLLGIDALIFGVVDAYNIDTQTGTTRVERQVDTGRTRQVEHTNGEGQTEIIEETIYETVEVDRGFVLTEGTMAATFRLANITTGEIVAIKTETAHFAQQAWDDEDEDLPTRDEVLDVLANDVAHRFLGQIHPRTVAFRVSFEDSEAPGTELGISYAQNGLWDEAYQALSRAALAAPYDPAAQYNEAAVAHVMGLHREAEMAIRRAIDLDPQDKYIQMLARIRHEDLAR